MTLVIDTRSFEALSSEIRRRLPRAGVEGILVAQAQRRISRGGDSEIDYPELWATQVGIGYRSGGQPLRDSGLLASALSAETDLTDDGATFRLVDGTPGGYGAKHQGGFVNAGPVVVALTQRAAKYVPGDSPHDVDSLRARFDRLGFRELGPAPRKGRETLVTDDDARADYLVLKGDHYVPPRPIFNLPPDEVAEIRDAVLETLA